MFVSDIKRLYKTLWHFSTVTGEIIKI
jgi:hypothetical protein